MDRPNGLSGAEAVEKLKREGYNELPASKPKSAFRLILGVLKEPMLILLMSCGTLYLLLGDFGEGMMLMSSMIIVIAISYFQERKAERALDELRDLTSPRALVIREGKQQRIPGKEVVRDDLVILQEGDRVPADGIVLSATNLLADESLLTGESEPAAKMEEGEAGTIEKAESNAHRVSSGTMIVRGHGIAKVTATGVYTEIGKIGKMLNRLEDQPTLLQQATRKIVRTFFILGSAVCILLIIVYGVTRGNWMDGVLYGLSLAMAMMPEEFAVVLTLFMALGAWRLSKQNVLTRKAASIETLGSITVLCTDKTGTLTENRMVVRKLWMDQKTLAIGDGTEQWTEKFNQLARLGILASQSNPFDPMEKAIVALQPGSVQRFAETIRLQREYPLTPQLFAMSRAYTISNDEFLVAGKGAPEAIASLCRLNTFQRAELSDQVKNFAAEGYRVLGVAEARWKEDVLPEQQQDFDFRFAGLIALEDPIRKTVKADLQSCYKAGIRVIMVTGDYPGTAQHVAREMGLKNPEEVITGSELATMDEPEINRRIRTTNIFARVVPDQKLRLVEALKNSGEIIAMTGDGVNDAPALRAAHIGIAMGQRGTDVAREAADLVLLDDNFSSVITAVRLGRRIYDNIRKAMTYILAVHVPIAGLTLIPLFFPVFPILLFPLHIAFMELIIDPASTLIFEAETEEKNTMTRPPADLHIPTFGWKRIVQGLLLGCSVLAICMAVVMISGRFGSSPDESRTLTFTTLVIANLALIYINRSHTKSIIELMREKNTAVKWVAGGAMALLGCILFIAPVRSLFHFEVLHADDLLICFIAGTIGIAWFEILKTIRRKFGRSGGTAS